eukprot:TRINITY_DN1641_c0_g2_i3.p2 TRINITY_DN1641_c0_g2~~TRINITY_DN1641_c0_g2_i3.p2  ORF type:complete len:207 (+),score=-7.38 TRINITY_DN1641_c0_g2_i3:526-1146(+)
MHFEYTNTRAVSHYQNQKQCCGSQTYIKNKRYLIDHVTYKTYIRTYISVQIFGLSSHQINPQSPHLRQLFNYEKPEKKKNCFEEEEVEEKQLNSLPLEQTAKTCQTNTPQASVDDFFVAKHLCWKENLQIPLQHFPEHYNLPATFTSLYPESYFLIQQVLCVSFVSQAIELQLQNLSQVLMNYVTRNNPKVVQVQKQPSFLKILSK